MTKHVAPPKIIIDTPRVFAPLLRRRRFRGIKGGRGSGKSHFVGEDLVETAIRQHTRAVCAREVQNSIKDSSKQLIEDKINLLAQRVAGAIFAADQSILVPGDSKIVRKFLSQWRITEREIIYTPTDSLFIFRGLQNHTAASIKSLEGFTDFWAEEAQTLTQRSIDLAVPTFRKGSQLTFTWNPDQKGDPVEKIFSDEGIIALKPGMKRPPDQDPDFCLVEANYYDNPYFPEELRRDMERDKRRDPDKYRHVWLGGYRMMSGSRVFTNWKVEDFETPANARFYFGADWGFSVDPTALIRCWIGRWENGRAIADPKGDKLFIDREAYAVGCEIDNTPALFAGNDVREPPRWQNPNKYPGIPGATEWPLTADNARPETISYMKRHGFGRIQPSIKGKGSVEDGIEFIKNFDIIVHPDCIHAIDELASYSYKIDKKTNEILPVLEDDHNHVIDAIRYALESTRRSNYTLSNL
ncbi:terminase large subunit [Rhizobium phage RHEph06]|uniref:Putative terminase protein large subunit n=2 Tax=Kleczkowskavirus RHEph4 TaxID=1921526 RepID=L7TKU1_9CAUD|nr:terminase large subunit [Rhizobium phage RHEph06]YP_009598451.1 terminase large subunit [Rhizobium phage RHEph04]AGC35771.1 putative terminase protein large subunit [Rhizobium phage RHEph05]QIG69502.1 terminase large subunit protein [Rhizobium phage RHph_I36]QIG75376.1 terminase large subunit protein [Rhizobium phage RHph_Y1_1]QIG75926.1 terminase large subunit protein [Rhizobium phage RHph_Y2_17_2]QXV74888.1 terminase large subunit protein [Rhizobium phage RHEph26]